MPVVATAHVTESFTCAGPLVKVASCDSYTRNSVTMESVSEGDNDRTPFEIIEPHIFTQ